jgi:hypothetical protein
LSRNPASHGDNKMRFAQYIEEGVLSKVAIAGAEGAALAAGSYAVNTLARKATERREKKEAIEDLEYEKKILRGRLRRADDSAKESIRRQIDNIDRRIEQIKAR